MNPKTRHIFLITLCVISALPMCLSAFFLGGRILIRRVMLEKLETAETIVLQLPANGLHWYEKDHELLIDGRMFDVKSIRPTDQGFEVTGLFDDDETELFEQLVKRETGKQEGQGQVSGLFQSCLGLIAESLASPVLPRPGLDAYAHRFAESPASPLWHITLDQQGPPPKKSLS
jgi:hypothetical protein